MRIGLSTSVIQRGRSGVAQYVLALVRALLPHTDRHEFTLFVLEEDRPLFAFAETKMNLVPVAERFRPPLRDIVWHQTMLPRLARTHGLEVLHVPSYRRMVRRAPCALVATIHDLAPFRVPGKYDWTRMLYGRVVARRLAQQQNEIIAVSRATADDIHGFFGVPRDRVTVIHNGVDHARFAPGDRTAAKRSVAERHGVHGPFFLYISRLEHPAKNHVRLIEAFDRFKAATNSAWQLVLGGSDWHGAAAIHARIAQSPYASDIRRLGFVAADDLPTWYRAAEVFVYPSLFEGFGLPPVEAMACGCPVLCSRRGALGEVVGFAAAIVEPEDVTAIQRQLAQLADDEHLRLTLRETGLARARHFDWHRAAAQTLDTYTIAAAVGRRAA
jgi:glycosyltransferase involved in cell wall biosynthesis